ncbi:hypothetical protein BGZ94_002739 [Podila epigama]|nr:hypothetical protein BGZ94_002739 [Podila epigama]
MSSTARAWVATVLATAITFTPAFAQDGVSSPVAPMAAARMAYASNGTHLFIQGGIDSAYKPFTQFHLLDLTQSWPANMPLWSSLPQAATTDGESISGTSGALTMAGDSLVVIGTPQGDSGRGLFQYSIANSSWTRLIPSETSTLKGQGPVMATDISSGNIYLLGDGGFVSLNQTPVTLQSVEKLSSVNQGYAAAWSPFLKAFLSTQYSQSNSNTGFRLVKYVPGTTQGWEAVETSGGNITGSRAGHCFVPNQDGTKFFLYGGTINKDVLSDDLHILDVATSTWTVVPPSDPPEPRQNMACTVARDILVVWGGFNDSHGTFAPVTPLLYDLTAKAWTTTFAPSPSQPQPTPSPQTSSTSHLGPSPTQGNGVASPKTLNKGAIIGGSVGGVVLIILVVALCILCRRRRARQRRHGRSLSMSKASGGSGGGFTGSNDSDGRYVTMSSPFVSDSQYELRESAAASTAPYGALKTPKLPHIVPASPFPVYVSPEEKLLVSTSGSQNEGYRHSYEESLLAPPPPPHPPIPPHDTRLQHGSSSKAETSHPSTLEATSFANQDSYAQATSSREEGQRPNYNQLSDAQTVFSDTSEQGTVDLIPITPSEAGSYHSIGNSPRLSRAPTTRTLLSASPVPPIPSRPTSRQQYTYGRRDSRETTDLDFLEPATY